VNLVANEWLVKTASMSGTDSPEKLVQETLMGAADQMPNMTVNQRKEIVREILENQKEFSELHAAANAVLTSLTEGVNQSSSAYLGSGAEHAVMPIPCLRGKCD
jgi:hypothetical protein